MDIKEKKAGGSDPKTWKRLFKGAKAVYSQVEVNPVHMGQLWIFSQEIFCINFLLIDPVYKSNLNYEPRIHYEIDLY